MNYGYVLILWSAFMNSLQHHNDGAIIAIDLPTLAACEQARETVKKAARYIEGVCIPKGGK